MRILFKALAFVCLSNLALAGSPEAPLQTSLRPVARGVVDVVFATAEVLSSQSSAGIRPEARPEVFEAALAAKIMRRMSGFEPVERSQPVEFMKPILAFATASPLAVAQTLRPARRSEALVQKVMAKRRQRAKGSVCGDPDLQGETVGYVPGRINACGIDNGVRLKSVGGIALSQKALIDCPTAKALKKWVNKGLKPAVGSRGGGVARIKVAAHYACRTRNNQPGAKVSEHGRGRAIDISGITLRDGSKITVLQGWGTQSSGKALKTMHKRACGIFGTVLGPNSDRFHQDHFHFDTARHRGGSYCR